MLGIAFLYNFFGAHEEMKTVTNNEHNFVNCKRFVQISNINNSIFS